MSHRILQPLVWVTAGLLLLTGCTMLATPTPTATEQAEAQATAVQEIMPTLELAGTAWQLDSFGEVSDDLEGLPDIRPTVNYFLTRYGGYGGCNWFLGVYDVDESNMRMMTPAQTRGFCDEPGVMEQEGTFMSALINVTEYELDGDTLIGYTVENQRMITLVPAETVPLEGTTWLLRFIVDGTILNPIIPESTVSAQFEGDQMAGSGGCNNYSAPIEMGEETLTVGPAVSQRMACEEPSGVMDQEQYYLTSLESVVSYSHAGNTLVMYDADDEPLLIFGAQLETEVVE